MATKDRVQLGVLRFSALGDVAMCVPVLLALRRTYPELQVLFLTKARFAPLVLKVQGLEVLILDHQNEHKGVFGLYRYSKLLRERDLSAFADFHNVLRSRILSIFLNGSGLSRARLDKARAEKRALTRVRNKVWKPLTSTHLRYAEVLGDLGWPVALEPTDVLPKEEFPPVFGSLNREKMLVGLAPYAAHPGKCYPLDKMETLIGLLRGHPDIQIVLFGGGTREAALLKKWEESYENCTSIAGVAGLQEELALISNLQLMVSMDSGNGHLAAMYGIPVISIWGVTHPYTGFSPFAQPSENALTADRKAFPAIPTSIYGNKVPDGYEAAIASIPPERIYRRILEVLGKSEEA